jgi:hypothetical protein
VREKFEISRAALATSPTKGDFTMRNSHRVTALSVCLVILASIFAVACTDPSARPANSPDAARASERRER